MPLRLRAGLEIRPFDTSTLEPRYLVCLPEGGRFQISARLRDVLVTLDGTRSSAEACAALAAAWGQEVTPDNLNEIARRYLQPYGLLADEITSRSSFASRGPLLVRLRLLPAGLLAPLTRAGQHLFTLPFACAIVLASLAVRFMVYLYTPPPIDRLGGSPLWVPALVLLGILWHELGHVSACRHYGCAHGELGIGLYAVFPVFYTDVTDTWRLSRQQRAVVDLAGVYFQLAFCVLLYVLYTWAGWPSALTALLITDGTMLLALNPILRFDGYWLFSDLIGVPNLRRRAIDTIGYAVQKLIRPKGVQRPDLLRLPFAAMASLVVYAFVSNALLLYIFGSLLFHYAPGMVAGYPRLLNNSWGLLRAGMAQGDMALILGALQRPLTTTLVLVMLALMIWRGRRLLGRSWDGLGRWISARRRDVGSPAPDGRVENLSKSTIAWRCGHVEKQPES